MITYIIKSVFCSGLLLGIYLLFLEREKMHQFNRFYLLSICIISWIIPLVTFKIAPANVAGIFNHILPSTNVIERANPSVILINTNVEPTPVNYLTIILWSIYGIITLILLVIFIINLYKINKQIRGNSIQKFDEYSLVDIPNNSVSFSFFKYIFPAEDDYECGQMNANIFLHEMVHVRQKHSLDIMFMELMKVFLWINPFVFLNKKCVQLNHEFIADEEVIDMNRNVIQYQNLLLSKITQIPISQLVCTSNYSITKKRFIMMTKKTKGAKSFCLKLSLIPVFAALIFFFSGKVIAQNTTTTSASLNLPMDWIKAGSAPKSYDMGVEKGAGRNGGNAATIKSIDKKIDGFGTLMQNSLADKYLGKRVRMSAYLKTKDVTNWSGLWFRVDQKSSKQPLSFDNMHDGGKDRSIKGTTNWTKYEIVLDVPSNASNLAFGALLVGTGQIWFDKINFEVVDNSTPTTRGGYGNTTQNKEPANLNFEK